MFIRFYYDKNPELLSYAGLIYFNSGKKDEGKKFLQQAVKNNPIIPTELMMDVKKALRSLS